MTSKGDDTGQPTNPRTNVVVIPQDPEPRGVRVRATSFVREHPVMTLACGLAAGAVAAALIPRRNRKFVARRGSVLAEAIAAAGTTIARQALASLDSASGGARRGARSLASRAEQAGGTVIGKADRARRGAYDRARSLLDRARPAPPTLAERVAARAGEIAHRLRG